MIPVSLEIQQKVVCLAYGKILFVGENQEKCIAKLVFVQHPLQLLTCLDNTISIIAVDDEDDALSVLEVVSPQRPDLILSTDVPHRELNVLVFDSLDVEAYWEHGKLGFHRDQKVAGAADSPMVGIVVLSGSAGQSDQRLGGKTYTISPSFNLYKMVVFPAASRPTIKIRISFFPHSLSKSFENVNPMFTRYPEV